jgi:hypothetical protein
MQMTDKILPPESIINDLYNYELNFLCIELYKKLTLKEYDYSNPAFIIVTVNNDLNYNATVLNEIKRQYLMNGWGNLFYNIKRDSNEISFQLYYPQKNQIL